MSQVRQKTERVGEIAAKAVVQLLFSTGKSFTVDGLREKLREFFRQEVRAELRAVAALSNVELNYRAWPGCIAEGRAAFRCWPLFPSTAQEATSVHIS
jgi:hypothetical protein